MKLAYEPSRLGQYASSPGNRAYCYAELVVSSLAMAVTIASTHCAYPRRDGQAELTKNHKDVNPSIRRVKGKKGKRGFV